MANELRKLKREAAPYVREGRRILKKYGKRLSPATLAPLDDALHAFLRASENPVPHEMRDALKKLQHLLDTDYATLRKSVLREWIESLGLALLIALLLRSFVVEPFKIPSGSMIPTLLVGDHLFVSKLSYGIRLPILNTRVVDWSLPERGDVIVFVYPEDPSLDYIKRIVGLPGDRVVVEGTDVTVNGAPIKLANGRPYSYVDERNGQVRSVQQFDATFNGRHFNELYEADHPHPHLEYTVPADHFFVMGDNRDNSADSRVWGFVPFANIKGRALVVWWSASDSEGIRFSRFGHVIE